MSRLRSLAYTLGVHVQQGYSSRLCVCVCLSVITLATTAFVHGPKVRYHRLLYDDFLDKFCKKKAFSWDMVLFAYHVEPWHFVPTRRCTSSSWQHKKPLSWALTPAKWPVVHNSLSDCSSSYLALASWPDTRGSPAHCAIVCNVHSCGYSSSMQYTTS